jgi:murein DD-endopeptidase MepM/ murein hydrolase activator NlpD
MRRVDRVRLEKRRRLALTLGLAFSLGALTAGGLIWRTDRLAADGVVEQAAAQAQTRDTDESPAATSGRSDATYAETVHADTADVVELLKARRLDMPVDGVSKEQLHDTFEDRRSGGLRRHEALDIMAPKGTPVRAVEDGRIAKLFTSLQGGLTIYLFDPSGMFAYYYAHLERYAAGLHDGQQVRRGDLIGYVDSTGNASEDAPHLHFAIFQLGPERQWWKGEPINPYPVLR